MTPTYGLTAHFEIEPDQSILTGERFAPPIGMKLLDRPGGNLMGPPSLLDLKDTEPTPCISGHQLEILTLDLPPGKHPMGLPPGADVKTGNLHFTSHWTFDGSRVTSRREFTSAIDEPLCTGKVRSRRRTLSNKFAPTIGRSSG